ncbi:hypothetical protein V1511DRAFT_516577 [Dipodascopsis uninucleata]
MQSLLSLPDEILLQIYRDFRGSDFYGTVLVNRYLNKLFTCEMYRDLRLYLPKNVESWERSKTTQAFTNMEELEEDDYLSEYFVNLFENVTLTDKNDIWNINSSSDQTDDGKNTIIRKYKKGSGILLKRTFKENPELASLVKSLTVVGHDLQPEDISVTEDGMPEFPAPPDEAYKGVRKLLSYLTNLESLSYEGDSAQLSAFIYSIPKTITSLILERLPRLQFGDIYMFRNLKRITLKAPPISSDKSANGQYHLATLSKSVIWETLYAMRMLLEQNSSSLEELVLANWNLEMLFEGYVPLLPRLRLLVLELAVLSSLEADSSNQNASLLLPTSALKQQSYCWAWLYDLIKSTVLNLKVFISCSNPICSDFNSLQRIVKDIDLRSLQRISGRRIKRKSLFKGHQLSSYVDWKTNNISDSLVLNELNIRRHRIVAH